MNKIKKFIILIVIVINAQLLQANEDLIELSCADTMQCKQFESPGINSSCIHEQCQCISSNGKSVKCQPVNPSLNNFIGGSCPCRIPNADCDQQQNICYCVSDYVPSADKRRCMPKSVALDATCEETSQCQKSDVNAICHESKECRCMTHFVNDGGTCASALGSKSHTLKNDTQCRKEFGANTQYSSKYKQCICVRGYFANIDNSKCLKVSEYLENCAENLQCIGTMGTGGMCVENVCKCAEKYFVEEKKSTEGAVKSVCTPFVERGQYCRYDEDCYQRQMSESEQSMHCSYGECNCKNGFNSFNEGPCIQGSGDAGLKFYSLSSQIMLILISTIVML